MRGQRGQRLRQLSRLLQLHARHGCLPAPSGGQQSGLFCLVWRDTGQYYFQNAAGSTGTYPVTAADAYTTWQCLSGFIIGTTNVPDLSSGQLSLVAYDAVCPNCFSESTIQRRLTFADEGTAHCTRCDRDYDLNNFGIVTQGGAGRSLFRYRVYYAADRLVVNN